MKLEDLYPDITDISEHELVAFMVAYSNQRQNDLFTPVPVSASIKTKSTTTKRKRTTIPQKLPTADLTPEQIEVLKKLNII